MTANAFTPPVPQSLGTRHSRWLGFDPWLLLLVAGMIAFGLVMVYSASWDVSFRLHGDANALFRRQLGNLVIGLLAMGLTAWMPIRWQRFFSMEWGTSPRRESKRRSCGEQRMNSDITCATWESSKPWFASYPRY